jgi:hypothetical protein
VGQAFSFSGPEAYVALPTNFFPFPTTGTSRQPFTFEVWFQTSSGGVILGQQIFPAYSSGPPSGTVPGLYVGIDGKLRAELFWGGSVSPLTTTATVADGKFHHAAVSYDGTNQVLYLDGVSVATNKLLQTAYASTYYYQLGTGYAAGSWPENTGGWYQFEGLIDEPSLYSRALTPQEITSIYEAGNAGKCFTNDAAPVFVLQPTNQTVWVGTPLTLAGAAMGTPRPQYQWLTNGTPLVGATNPTLVFNSIAANQGGVYTLVANNTAGVATCVATNSVVGTPVSGTIVNQIWTSNSSPYVVFGDINVADLTILPGVTVLFASNYTFEVDGTLQALGALGEPVLFTATNAGWQGLFFNYASPGCALVNCIIANSVNSGLRIESTTPSISACIISNNAASCSGLGGGGIWSDSPLALKECTIISNTVSCSRSYGAGIYSTAPLNLTDCTVSGNVINAYAPYATSGSSAALSDGVGIWCSTNLTLESCRVVGNSGSAYGNGWFPESIGGGIICGATLTLQNCIVSGNAVSAVTDPGPSSSGAYGAGVISVQLLATNTLFDHNSSYAVGRGTAAFPNAPGYSQGAAIYLYSGAQIVNCTIAYNTTTAGGNPAVPQGSGIFSAASTSSNVQVINSILWGGAPDQLYGLAAVSYSDVQGGQSGAGNINRNPVFLAETNLIIVPGSPCVDAGSTNAIYNDVYFPPSLGGPQNDMGAHGGPGAGARFRYLLSCQQLEVILLGAVPGYTYLIQGSTDFLSWETLEQVQVGQLGDAVYYLEPSITAFPRRFYRLSLAP